MRSVKLMGLMALLAGGMAYGASQVVYTVETGGNNQSTLWEANQAPSFLSGVTDGSTTLTQGQNLTWAVRVSCGGLHENPGGAGDGSVGFGAANLVFDLQVYEADGTTPVILDAAPLGCDPGGTGVPGTPGVKNCAPTGKGYWSSINDGDQDGSRGTILNAPDLLANAAFAIAIHNQSSAPAQLRSLIDPVSPTPSGPNFDYGWYPTGNGRGGIDIAGTKTISTTVSGLSGLVGFGAGMKSYEFTNYRPGVGRFRVIGLTPGFGANIGSDPLNPTADERPLFEGQINTTGLAPATYVLKVIPSADGTNIIHGNVVWNSTTADYGGFGSFAVKANQVHALPAAGVAFTVNPPEAVTEIVARKLFYNQSFYDGNKVAIDPAPIAGANNDDADAIDNGGLFATVNWPAKTPLMTGGGQATLANWTGYNKGINGLIYDIKDPVVAPVVGDFVFHNIGKAGTVAVGPGSLVAPTAFATQSLGGGVTRVLMTFTGLTSTWLRVEVGTGFGLSASEVHYWGNADGDTGQGNSGTNILVSPTDEIWVRTHPTTPLARSPVQDMADVNKDGIASPTDQIYVRTHPTTPLNAVKMITR